MLENYEVVFLYEYNNFALNLSSDSAGIRGMRFDAQERIWVEEEMTVPGDFGHALRIGEYLRTFIHSTDIY